MKISFKIFLALAICNLHFAAAQSVPIKNAVLQGTINGTPSGGTLNLSSVTLTLPGFADGTSSAPGIKFSSDTDTGFYRIGANNIGITAGTTVVGAWSTTGLSLGSTIATTVGTAASPILTFGGTGDGFYTPADNQIGIGIGGSSVAVMSASTLTLGSNVAIAFAGTGAATTRTNIGLSIGTDVQAYDADLTTYAATTPGTGALAQYITPAIYQSTATAAGTTTLTVTSEAVQRFSGTNTQACKLPDTSTLTTGWSRLILNDSTKNVEIQTSAATTVKNLQPGQSCRVVCISTAANTSAAWRVCDISGTLWTAHKKTAAQTFAAGTTTAITFPTNYGGNSAVFVGDTFTAPSTGTVEISAVIPFECNATDGDSTVSYIAVFIRKNASDDTLMNRLVVHQEATSYINDAAIFTAKTVSVTAGDTIKVRLNLDTAGGTETVTISDTAYVLVKYTE